ncbi:hypothetical protein IGI04_009665 [Brassica rapa subsp. trilocularis]|uniref:Uncharacterized protein n=1 Tax=Brassica rapa subsp. trilocularis TaxID=1813537 RepID=A0ABQ7MXX1_BRACM|nr:hypothetical protein IGI04_009665 [Brassica rapa subsp. trilocularis]
MVSSSTVLLRSPAVHAYGEGGGCRLLVEEKKIQDPTEHDWIYHKENKSLLSSCSSSYQLRPMYVVVTGAACSVEKRHAALLSRPARGTACKGLCN